MITDKITGLEKRLADYVEFTFQHSWTTKERLGYDDGRAALNRIITRSSEIAELEARLKVLHEENGNDIVRFDRYIPHDSVPDHLKSK